jgi:xanthine dehydrogenase molybdopterin-binding subunit B
VPRERKGKGKNGADRFPETLAVSVSGPKDKPFFSIHRGPDFSNVSQDTLVGVYKFKRVSLIKVTRALQRNPKE